MRADTGNCDSEFYLEVPRLLLVLSCLSWCVSLAFLIPLGGDLQCVCLLSNLLNLINLINVRKPYGTSGEESSDGRWLLVARGVGQGDKFKPSDMTGGCLALT